MTTIRLNDGNVDMHNRQERGYFNHEPDLREQPVDYTAYDGHPFVKEVLRVARDSGATLTGVHIDVVLDDDKQPDGVMFDYEPYVKDNQWNTSEHWGLRRDLRDAGFLSAPKVDGRFRFNESEYALVVTGHRILGTQLPADLTVETATPSDARTPEVEA